PSRRRPAGTSTTLTASVGTSSWRTETVTDTMTPRDATSASSSLAPGTSEALGRLGELRSQAPVISRRRRAAKEPSTWRVNMLRVGIVVGILTVWEVGANLGWIDAFFWSQPSQIWD